MSGYVCPVCGQYLSDTKYIVSHEKSAKHTKAVARLRPTRAGGAE